MIATSNDQFKNTACCAMTLSSTGYFALGRDRAQSDKHGSGRHGAAGEIQTDVTGDAAAAKQAGAISANFQALGIDYMAVEKCCSGDIEGSAGNIQIDIPALSGSVLTFAFPTLGGDVELGRSTHDNITVPTDIDIDGATGCILSNASAAVVPNGVKIVQSTGAGINDEIACCDQAAGRRTGKAELIGVDVDCSADACRSGAQNDIAIRPNISAAPGVEINLIPGL